VGSAIISTTTKYSSGLSGLVTFGGCLQGLVVSSNQTCWFACLQVLVIEDLGGFHLDEIVDNEEQEGVSPDEPCQPPTYGLH
jgi:hypothetical protein